MKSGSVPVGTWVLLVATIDSMAQSPVRVVTEHGGTLWRGGCLEREKKKDQEEAGGCFTTLPRCHCASSSLAVALNLPPNSFLHPGIFSSSCYLETEENMPIFRLLGKIPAWNYSNCHSICFTVSKSSFHEIVLKLPLILTTSLSFAQHHSYCVKWINTTKWVILVSEPTGTAAAGGSALQEGVGCSEGHDTSPVAKILSASFLHLTKVCVWVSFVTNGSLTQFTQ